MANDWNITKTKHKRKNSIKTELLERDTLINEKKQKDTAMSQAIARLAITKIMKTLSSSDREKLQKSFKEFTLRDKVAFLKAFMIEDFKLDDTDNYAIEHNLMTKESIYLEKIEKGLEILKDYKERGFFKQ